MEDDREGPCRLDESEEGHAVYIENK